MTDKTNLQYHDNIFQPHPQYLNYNELINQASK